MNYEKLEKKLLKQIRKMQKLCRKDKCRTCKTKCILMDLVSIESKVWKRVIKDEK